MVSITIPPILPPSMSRSSSSSTITLVPSTPPHKFLDSPTTTSLASFDLPPVRLPCLDLSAVKVTKPIKAQLSTALAALERPLRIVGLLATADSGCHMYADMTARACKAAEVCFDKMDLSKCREMTDDAAFEHVKAAIGALNNDTSVDGLIVYFPLFTPERDASLRAMIHPRIDVEGVNPTSLERSYSHAPETVHEFMANPATGTVYPCTALAVFRSLQSPDVGVYAPSMPFGERFRGKVITIINRSETVGRPLAGMLANDGARVFSVDIDSTHIYERFAGDKVYTATPYPGGSPSLDSLLADSDIVVSAIPGESFKVKTAALRPGAVCIDLSEHGNYEQDVRARAGVFAPRLGSVTILMLKLNALVLHYRARAY